MASSSFKQTQMDEDRNSWPLDTGRTHHEPPRSVVSEGQSVYRQDIEIINHLKNKRSSDLGLLTRKKNEKPLTDNLVNLDRVLALANDYDAAFNIFRDAQNAYDNVLQDGDAKTQSFMYSIDVKVAYLEFIKMLYFEILKYKYLLLAYSSDVLEANIYGKGSRP